MLCQGNVLISKNEILTSVAELMHFTSIEAVEDYLDSIPKFSSVGTAAANFKLDRFKNFCKQIGNPQNSFASIHVAGTNGKGSTCRILSTIYRQANFDVGLFTSPHLQRFNERFEINKEQISDEQLITFFNLFTDRIESAKLTYFEISTAIAFWWFAKSKVDIAIIEVGLGGRLDATNIIDPLVSIITSISLDHTNILGNKIEDIAGEKGGIIKAGKPVVIGKLPREARKTIDHLAGEKEAPVYAIDGLEPQYLEPGKYRIKIDGDHLVINTNLRAPVQAVNLAIAWQVIQLLKDQYPISLRQFTMALHVVTLDGGRFEKLLASQDWYFDGAHNLEAVKAMKEAMRTIGPIEDTVLVLSMMKDKVRPEVMVEFSEFKNIFYYQLNLERAATFDDIKQWLPQVTPIPCNQGQQSFLNDFDSKLVIFAGSFYLYRKVREWVRNFV